MATTTENKVLGWDGTEQLVASVKSFVTTTVDNTAAVSYNSQTLTEEQKAQARANIGAIAEGEGGAGESGEDGFSPIATVEQTATGAKITITDKTGTTTATVTNGKDGGKGDTGTSVTVKSVSESTADGGNNVVTFSDGKTLTVKNGKTGAKGDTGAAGKDYSFDPTVYGLPVLNLSGNIGPIAVSKDNKVTLSYVYGDRSGTCTLKGQGATSYKTAQALVNAGKAGKFNYTITFDNPFEAKTGWGAQKKYCLKANFIDTTQSRNICSCKLWGMSVKSRPNVPVELADLPNGGAIDGFPIIIMLNGEFHGLYTWNIPKDGWMFGLVEDATKTQAIVGADDHTAATQFKEASMSGYEVEFVSDEDNAAWVETSLTRLISAVINSDGSDLDTTVAQYLDWDSAIDHYIHTVVDKAFDCVDKNYLLVTYDGVKWYMSVYDRDSIHGLSWDASGLSRPVSNVSFIECAETVKVYELIKRFKTNALKARYKELRGNILSESRIMQIFENFAWAIPSPVMLEDVKLYPTILGSGVNTIDQIGRFVRQRLVRCDEWIDALPAQESTGGSTVTTYAVTNALSNCVSSNGATAVNANTAYSATITASDGYTLDGATVSVTMGGTDITSTAYSNGSISIASVTGAVVITVYAVKKATGYTNLVPISTDTDGSIYNGTGYKDNARLSSSGDVSGTAQDDSVVTGFIPFKASDIIRIKGAEWVGATQNHGGHYYLHLYNTSKTSIGYLASETHTNNPGAVSAVYDETTGVTTIDANIGSGFGNVIANAAYFRINAYGKGADLIVTVNEEITDRTQTPEQPWDGYTNLVPTAIDTDGSIYKGDGYETGYRLSSSGATKAADTHAVTGFIPYSNTSGIIRVKGIGMDGGALSDGTWTSSYIVLYDESFTKVGHAVIDGTTSPYSIITNAAHTVDSASGVTTITIQTNGTAFSYMRVSGIYTGPDVIVTVNQEIT